MNIHGSGTRARISRAHDVIVGTSTNTRWSRCPSISHVAARRALHIHERGRVPAPTEATRATQPLSLYPSLSYPDMPNLKDDIHFVCLSLVGQILIVFIAYLHICIVINVMYLTNCYDSNNLCNEFPLGTYLSFCKSHNGIIKKEQCMT